MDKPCTKKSYATRLEARTALLHFYRRGRSERSSYFCELHQAWHLTKKRRRAP